MQTVIRHLQGNLVAYTALLFALCGTSFAAASYINGKQIKPHSIPKNRLTGSAIKSLRGARGPTGPAGFASVTVVGGRTTVQCPVFPGGACQAGQSDAVCPAGSVVVGGGFISQNSHNYILRAAPIGGDRYSVIAYNESTAQNLIIAQATCASGPGTSVTR
jgi:hypothetical protein